MPATTKPKRRPPAAKPYHHGDLRRVLIDAALRLAEQGGAEGVSVREAARLAGVSPGAPFRHFEIISTGRYFNHDGAAELSRDNAELIAMTGRLLEDARAQGQLRSPDLKTLKIAGRALVYGFARMNLDGHLPRWGVAAADIERTAEAVLDLFIGAIATPGKLRS